MVFSTNFRIGLSLLNKSIYISNKSLLGILQDIAEMHSSTVGFGVTDIEKTHFTWALLNWKVEIFNRPKYGDIIKINTWSSHSEKLYCFRDFEILNSNNELIGIATSKWVLINADTKKICKITDDLMSKYEPEEKSVFNTFDLPKLEELSEYSDSLNYSIRKSDIDVNEHVNNLCYLDMAYEILPYDLAFNTECNNFEILYKKQIKFNDNIKTFYGKNEKGEHFVVIKNVDTNILHSIMKFW